MTDALKMPTDQPAIRVMAMPADTNPRGDIFGGWLMSELDKAAAVAATERNPGRVATVAVESMRFVAPVKVGDLVSIFAKVISVGRTSMRIGMEGWSQGRNRSIAKVAEAVFVFVAIDEDGRPRPVDSD